MATSFGVDPLTYTHPQANCFRNIQYAPWMPCKLNVYKNATTVAGGNAVLIIGPGGGWNSNEKTTAVESTAERFRLLFSYLLDTVNYPTSALPFSIVSYDYRKHSRTNASPGSLNTPYERTIEGTNPGTSPVSISSYFPECVEDAQTVVQWTKQNADRFGFNPDKIVLSGGSAGATVALLAALNPSRAHLPVGVQGRRFDYNYSSRVSGCLAYYPAIDSDPWQYNFNGIASEIGIVGNDARQRAQMERALLLPDASGSYPDGSPLSPLGKATSPIHNIRAQRAINAALKICSVWWTLDDPSTPVSGYAGIPPFVFHDVDQEPVLDAECTSAGIDHTGIVGDGPTYGDDPQLTWESTLAPTYSWLQGLFP